MSSTVQLLFVIILGVVIVALIVYGVRLAAMTTPDDPGLESAFRLHLTEESLTCTRPNGTVEQVRWNDLQRVEILGTPDGPLLPDMFWVLHGSAGTGCVVPWGVPGDDDLLARLQQLRGFDNDAVVSASGHTEERLTLCWQRSV